jgi:hypothetical protein
MSAVHPGRGNHLPGVIGDCESHGLPELACGRHATGNSFFRLHQSEALKTQHGFS